MADLIKQPWNIKRGEKAIVLDYAPFLFMGYQAVPVAEMYQGSASVVPVENIQPDRTLNNIGDENVIDTSVLSNEDLDSYSIRFKTELKLIGDPFGTAQSYLSDIIAWGEDIGTATHGFDVGESFQSVSPFGFEKDSIYEIDRNQAQQRFLFPDVAKVIFNINFGRNASYNNFVTDTFVLLSVWTQIVGKFKEV